MTWRTVVPWEHWWRAWRPQHQNASLVECVEAAWDAGVRQAMNEEGYDTQSALEFVESGEGNGAGPRGSRIVVPETPGNVGGTVHHVSDRETGGAPAG